MKFFIKLLQFLFILLFIFAGSRTYSQDCKYCCKRTAVLGEFVNLHNPNFDEEQAEWTKCMDSQLKGIAVFDPEDPRYKEAVENCKHLEPESWDYMYPTSVLSKLTQTFTTGYFHMVSKDYKGKRTEYMFKGSYEADINGTSGKTKQVKSRFILELYYNGGKTQELIKKWITESKINSIPAHYRKMFDNSDAKTRSDIPINEKLLWEYEKTPVECKIKPEKEHLDAGEKMEIELKDFRDRKGRDSREFNRIVVQVKEGKILNGEKSKYNPDYRVFTVGNGTITLSYKAPESCDKKKDIIYVYNSCDIIDPNYLPLSETETNTKIAEKEIKICPRCLEIDYVWEIHPGEEFRWGGKAHVDVCLDLSEEEYGGYTVLVIEGVGKGTQDCWVTHSDSKYWFENIYCPEFEVAANGNVLGGLYSIKLHTDTDISFDQCWHDSDGRVQRFEYGRIEGLCHRDGVCAVVGWMVIELEDDPNSTYTKSEDVGYKHFEATARWKN